MWLAEQLLFLLARSLYRTEIAHSSEMKNALQNIDAYDAHRAKEINRIQEAILLYGGKIVGHNIVDFGCNDGAISAEYLRNGAAKVFGVDIDKHAIQRAREHHRDDRLCFVHSTTSTIPLEDQSVEFIISYDVFEHVSQPATILQEFHRILASSGKVLIGTWSWRHPFAPHLWSTMPVPWAHVLFSEKTVLRVCRRVYHSSWYTPNMHDYDKNGKRREDKFTHEAISTDYLNKFLIKDFEQIFPTVGFQYKTHCVPFGSRYANWTRVFINAPWIREFIAGYVWFVLTKTDDQHLS